ncbi:hypothetical protein AB0E75_03165 [Streptomyces griseoviridis]|uniref:Extensin n=1 Tax=Streptomyces griseoviridis TaxID=45398 RepID=A0A918G9Z5_STRGD|nr:hypothetical protein [Streptomyces niveoruber]GGS24830.1 hypothetical protein GCM10010238_11220 [Streptomyces niveoruber]
MADKQGGWLDRETAERMLRGEPLDTVDPVARARAERLTEALGTLAGPDPRPGGELPGEAAALAAFRAARAERTPGTDPARHRDTGPHTTGAAAGTPLIRIGGRDNAARRVRRPRPLRLGLAAVLAAGMVGGVAVAAGSGALAPFGAGDPEPTASVAATPDRPAVSPSPRDVPQGGGADRSATAPAGGGDTPASTGPGAEPDQDTGSGAGDPGDGAVGGGWRALTASCRDLTTGKQLDGTRRRALSRAAGGSSRVRAYCAAVLDDDVQRNRRDGRDGRDGNDGGKNGGAGKGGKGTDGHDAGKGRGAGEDDEGRDGTAKGGAGPNRNANLLRDDGGTGGRGDGGDHGDRDGHGSHEDRGDRGDHRDRGRDRDRGGDRGRGNDGRAGAGPSAHGSPTVTGSPASPGRASGPDSAPVGADPATRV